MSYINRRRTAMGTSLNDDRRLDFRVPVDFLLNKYVKGRPYLCRAANISRCGLLVERIFEPELAQQRIGLQFQLPDTDRVITCAGRVLYDHEWLPANGVAFTAISEDHQALIDHFILEHLDWGSLAS
jgi:hypothetical protein